MTCAVSREDSSISIYFVCWTFSDCITIWVPQVSPPLNGQLPPMLWLTWPGPPGMMGHRSLSARYYRQPQWHQVKITLYTIITSHSGSTFQNSSDLSPQHKLWKTDRGCWTLDSNYHGIVFCVNISGADNAPEIGMKRPFLTAIWRRICSDSMKQRERGTHVVIGQGESQRRIDPGGRDKQYFKTKQSDVW